MADAVAAEALVALETAVTGLLPAGVPAGLTRDVRVLPQAVRSLGLGGFIGNHRAPDAVLQGRRIAARVAVSVTGGSDSTAQGYAATLTGQILTHTRAEFVQRGIHRIRSAESASGRALAFEIDFEYVQVPLAGEGTIDTLALETFNNLTPYRTRSVADFAGAALGLQPAPLADFFAFTDPDAAPPAAWSLNTTPPASLVQTANTVGGPLDLSDAQKAGAQLLWRPGGVALSLARFVASITFSSTSEDGVGLVFKRRAADDFFFFLASQRNGYHLFGRRQPAGWQVLATAAAGFSTSRAQRLVLVCCDGQLIAELDERRTLVAQTDVQTGGEIGLLTHGNNTARFQSGRLLELI